MLGQSVDLQADGLIRHRGRYRALGRNFRRSRSGPIVLRSKLLCASVRVRRTSERWSEPGCGYTLESSRPHSPPVRPATVLGKHKVVCLFGPRTTIIHAFFVHSSLNLAQCVSVRVDTPLDGAQCWHARSSTERTHLLQHRSRHTPPRASYSQGARAGQWHHTRHHRSMGGLVSDSHPQQAVCCHTRPFSCGACFRPDP